MIEIKHIEEVTQIRMSRGVAGRPLYWVAAYLIDGMLIDTGCKHTAKELVRFLKGQDLRFAVNTHHHEDHIGANHLLEQGFGIEIFAHGKAISQINQIPKIHLYRKMIWGSPKPSEVSCLPKKIETTHFHFDVIETPGHCKGHVVLVEPERGWCFSGDLFVSERPRVLRPEEEDISEYINSMRKLAKLKTDRLILFTSVGKIVKDGRKALRSCIKYFEDLSQGAKALKEKGLSLAAIRNELLGRENRFFLLTGGHYSSKNLIRAVLRV